MISAFAVLALTAAILPQELGEYVREDVSTIPIPRADRALFAEYGLEEAEHAKYVNRAGGQMEADSFRFATSLGGHAAYLWLRPQGAVTSRLGSSVSRFERLNETQSVVLHGVTLTGCRNLVFRFRGATPSDQVLEKMIYSLPQLAPEIPNNVRGSSGNVDPSSERLILGPVSLAKFLPRLPPSLVAFRLGAEARSARLEMPFGSVDRIIVKYPSDAIAAERGEAFQKAPGAAVQVFGSKVGVLFDVPDSKLAQDILNNLDPPAISFVPEYSDQLTLDGSIGMMFFGFLIGGSVAVLRRWARAGEGIADFASGLHLTERGV